MRISDWSSDVCSSDLIQDRAVWPRHRHRPDRLRRDGADRARNQAEDADWRFLRVLARQGLAAHARDRRQGRRVLLGRHGARRSEEHTSELQSLMRISYAVFCLKKKKNNTHLYKLSMSKTNK